MAFLLPGWDSDRKVEKVHSFFEYAETISLAVAIFLELAGMRRSSNVAWVALVISDVGRQLYGRRDKTLQLAEANEWRTTVKNLSERFVDRRLTPEQSKRMADFLAQFSGQSVNVLEYGMSLESMTFSDDIVAVLANAGWKIVPAGKIMSVYDRSGVFVLITPKAKDPLAAKALAWALRKEGFDVTYSYDGGMSPEDTPPDGMLLFVAAKPTEPVTPPQA
jgi:hypothetical protein